MVWALIIFLYSAAGGIFLFKAGEFLFFQYPEWEIFGGIAMIVALTALISIFALSNRTYIWTRVTMFMWPFVIVICAVRAIIMIIELQRGKSKIQWECQNGGQLWTPSVEAGYGTGDIPNTFCNAGFSSVNAAFIASLIVDLCFQMYMFFLMWRYQKRLEHYTGMRGPYNGGLYKA